MPLLRKKRDLEFLFWLTKYYEFNEIDERLVAVSMCIVVKERDI